VGQPLDEALPEGTTGEANLGSEAPGEFFACPHGIWTDSRGDLYVADYNNMRVQVFTSERAYSTTIGRTASTFRNPQGPGAS